MSVMSKMRIPRSRIALTESCTPSLPQSRRPPVPSPETKSRFLYTDTSLCDAGQKKATVSDGFAASLMSHTWKPA